MSEDNKKKIDLSDFVTDEMIRIIIENQVKRSVDARINALYSDAALVSKVNVLLNEKYDRSGIDMRQLLDLNIKKITTARENELNYQLKKSDEKIKDMVEGRVDEILDRYISDRLRKYVINSLNKEVRNLIMCEFNALIKSKINSVFGRINEEKV